MIDEAFDFEIDDFDIRAADVLWGMWFSLIEFKTFLSNLIWSEK